MMTASEHALTLTRLAAHAAAEKKATDIVAIDVSDTLAISDVFLLCSVANERQAQAVVDAIEAELDAIDVDPIHREGKDRWVLLDYADIVVHVQHVEERMFYDIQRLWKDCPTVDLSDVVESAVTQNDVGGPSED